MDRDVRTEERAGSASIRVGKTLIRITEFFPAQGQTLTDLLEDLILYAARQNEEDQTRN